MPITLNGNTGIVGPDGSASTPAIQGSDSNTGMFFPAADTIAFATAGTEDMRIDSVGNVGIGTTSPSVQLDLRKAATGSIGPQLSLWNTGTFNNTNTCRVSFTTDSGGSIGTPNGAIDAVQEVGTGGATSLRFSNWNGSAFGERARIDSSGKLLVGITSASAVNWYSQFNRVGAGDWPVCTRGTDRGMVIRCIGSSGIAMYFETNDGGSVAGQISVSGTSTTYATSSDYRLKEAVQPMTGALAKVAALKPVTYKWKADGSDGEGFIAHELAEVVPQCVTGEKDAVDAEGNPVYQGIDTSFLVATLTAAIQELTARVAALEGAQT
jgi:hypothetical protein